MTGTTSNLTKYDDGWGSYYREREQRGKWRWTGITPSLANSGSAPWHMRRIAERMLHDLCGDAQRAATTLCGEPVGTRWAPKAKPQLSPIFTDYPASLAAWACVGASGFQELQQRMGAASLRGTLAKNYLSSPEVPDEVADEVDAAIYRQLAIGVATAVEVRLLLHEAGSSAELCEVETYRIFRAAVGRGRLDVILDFVRALVLYGDLMPTPPLTAEGADLLGALRPAVAGFLDALCTCKAVDPLYLGESAVRNIMRALAPFIPKPDLGDGESPARRGGAGDATRGRGADARTPPLGQPHPPAVLRKPDVSEMVRAAVEGPAPRGTPGRTPFSLGRNLRQVGDAIEKANSQASAIDDMRPDLVASAVRDSAFGDGPMRGVASFGRTVEVRQGRQSVEGEVFEMLLEPTLDLEAVRELSDAARAVRRKLEPLVYPTVEHVPLLCDHQASGSLDRRRLFLAGVSRTVFKRYDYRRRPDRRGRPVVLLACDGSSSLNASQMSLLKILSCAFVESLARTRVRLMAALYTSARVPPGVTRPSVQWIAHPLRMPERTPLDAVATLAGLPGSGVGSQSDALSLALMLEEAFAVSAGTSVYVVLLTDAMWNSCLGQGAPGKEEVGALLRSAVDTHRSRLHMTVVSLGLKDGLTTGLEEIAQRVVRVRPEALGDVAAVADEIGTYVLSVLAERRHLEDRR